MNNNSMKSNHRSSSQDTTTTVSSNYESDPLLAFHSLSTASNNKSNPLYSSTRSPSNSTIFSSNNKSSSNLNNSSSNSSKSKSNKSHRAPQQDNYKVHRVSYTAQNHVQILFQMYGSALPQVLPFCLANILWTVVIYTLKEQQIADITFHSVIGHSFMGLLVSFLVVARSRISYDRFMEMRRYLAVAYRSCREIAQFTTVYTMHTRSATAQEWRQEVMFRTILLLRVTMDALRWSSTERHLWGETAYDDDNNGGSSSSGTSPTRSSIDYDVQHAFDSEHFQRFASFHHGTRTMIDENFRAPITFCHILREAIMRHPQYLGYKMPVNEYRDLLNFVTIFNEAFHGFRVLIFTPYPFPLVQMTRLFLFFWVYSLPLVLLEELQSVWDTIIIVSLITFGFVGIEYVSMALDDPFGDDTNDVDEHGMALLVYEDIYLAIYRTDGPACASKLRQRVLARYKQGRGLDCYRDDLRSQDFWDLEEGGEGDENADAFQAPLPLLAKPLVGLGSMATPPSSLLAGSGALSSFLEANNYIADIYQQNSPFWIAEGGEFDVVRNIAAGITVVVFLLAGVTYLYASFIIPAAAQAVEKECKELDPQLWEQYAAKLGDGETMASRPDLMQELGAKLQPLVEAKLREIDEAGLPTPLETTMNPFSGGGTSRGATNGDVPPSIPTTSSQWDSNDDIIDVAVIQKTTEDNGKDGENEK